MAPEKAEKLCGWPKPVLPKGSGVAHCSACHRKLRFDIHLNQWVHILKGDR